MGMVSKDSSQFAFKQIHGKSICAQNNSRTGQFVESVTATAYTVILVTNSANHPVRDLSMNVDRVELMINDYNVNDDSIL